MGPNTEGTFFSGSIDDPLDFNEDVVQMLIPGCGVAGGMATEDGGVDLFCTDDGGLIWMYHSPDGLNFEDPVEIDCPIKFVSAVSIDPIPLDDGQFGYMVSGEPLEEPLLDNG